MKYRDYKIGFSLDVPKYFSEVKETSYEVFDVAEGTLKYFILLDDAGEIARTFSIVRGEKVKTDKEFQEFVKTNIEEMEDNKFQLLKHDQRKTDGGKVIERCTFYNEEVHENLGLLMYFMQVKDEVIVSSTFIYEFYDEFEEEMFNIYNSIKEI